jgi:hypothetical protein
LPSIDSIIADVGTRAAAHVHLGVREQARRLKLRQLGLEDLQHRGILIADIEEHLLGLHRPGRDSHALQKLVRLPLQVDAVLKGAGLALVAIDRHQPWRLFGPHQRPLAPGRKSGPAEATQAAI